MLFGSVCSGIEAASVAFAPLNWHAVWFSEIEAFPSKLLSHRYPTVPNFGDMRHLPLLIKLGLIVAPDVLCGGTPCQAFSVAGLRNSLGDARGNLTLTFCEIANAIDDIRIRAGRPQAVVKWENVPGVLSTPDNAFGCFLGELAGEGSALEPEPRPAAGKSSRRWRWNKEARQHAPSWPDAGCVFGPRRAVAWRVLDAQYFGLAQRRRRVFVVASARTGFDPAAVLFESYGVRRDTPPSREARQEVAPTIAGGARKRGGFSHDDVPLAGTLRHTDGGADVDHALAGHLTVATLDANYGRLQGCSGQDANHGHSHLVAQCVTGAITHTLKSEGFDASEDGTGRGQPIVAFGGNNTSGPIGAAAALNANRGCHNPGDFEAGTLLVQPLPFDTTQITSATNRCQPQHGDPCHSLAAGGHPPAIAFRAGAGAKANGIGASTDISPTLGAAGHGSNVAPAIAFNARQDCLSSTEHFGPLSSSSPQAEAIAYTTKLHNTNSNNAGKLFEERTAAQDANSPPPALLTATQVRRLMPVECERLQGFPDGYTAIPWDGWRKLDESETSESCKAEGLEVRQTQASGRWYVRDVDGPRYKALGNSWPVPVVTWIARRIAAQLEQAA